MNDLDTYLPHMDLLINATSAGHIENINASPVSEKILKKAKKTMVVYDIIYDPIKTKLLKNSEELGLKTINGLRMNLIQAVIAYRYTNNSNLSLLEIYQAMNYLCVLTKNLIFSKKSITLINFDLLTCSTDLKFNKILFPVENLSVTIKVFSLNGFP